MGVWVPLRIDPEPLGKDSDVSKGDPPKWLLTKKKNKNSASTEQVKGEKGSIQEGILKVALPADQKEGGNKLGKGGGTGGRREWGNGFRGGEGMIRKLAKRG